MNADHITIAWEYSSFIDNYPIDYYNVRWSRPGRAETQVQINSGGSTGSWRLPTNRSDITYTFKVEACVSHFLGSSSCSDWGQLQVTTPAYGPDTCLQGYVWREAVPSDHVCVSPATRDQTAQDNSQADARRQPGGGPYGPDTCRQGYLWREAVAGDHVCVPPATRDQARYDNSQAGARRVG